MTILLFWHFGKSSFGAVGVESPHGGAIWLMYEGEKNVSNSTCLPPGFVRGVLPFCRRPFGMEYCGTWAPLPQSQHSNPNHFRPPKCFAWFLPTRQQNHCLYIFVHIRLYIFLYICFYSSCICMYIYIYIYIYICKCWYTFVHIRLYIIMYICLYIFLYILVFVYMFL